MSKRLHFLVALTNNDNDYQIEQAASAEEAGRRLGVEIKIVHADNDSVSQSQQLLKIVQSAPETRPDAIVFEPVSGTALPQVARAAVAAGIGWVVLNCDVDYITELRLKAQAPIFSLTSDHQEIGRIQGRQFAALLPKGGSVLYIQGPTESPAAKQRTAGMYQTKPGNVEVKVLKGQWTEASAYRAVASWLRLTTSQQSRIDLVAAQDDSMALGARKALQDTLEASARKPWLDLPFIGCDGLPKTGQAWVKQKILAATIFVPPNTGQALDMLVKAIRGGGMPPERTFTAPSSIPTLEGLAAAKARGSAV
jgi:ABC-type sugar transport system substrate-binding protein